MTWVVSAVNEEDNIIAEIADERIHFCRFKLSRTAGGPRGRGQPLPVPHVTKRELIVDQRPLHKSLEDDKQLALGRLAVIEDMVPSMDVNRDFTLDHIEGPEAISIKIIERRDNERLLVAEIWGAYGFKRGS